MRCATSDEEECIITDCREACRHTVGWTPTWVEKAHPERPAVHVLNAGFSVYIRTAVCGRAHQAAHGGHHQHFTQDLQYVTNVYDMFDAGLCLRSSSPSPRGWPRHFLQVGRTYKPFNPLLG